MAKNLGSGRNGTGLTRCSIADQQWQRGERQNPHKESTPRSDEKEHWQQCN